MHKTLILLFAIMASAALAANEDEIELMDRPNVGGDPVEVSFFVFVIDVDDIDGSLQNFTANVSLRLQWKDDRLAKETEHIRMMPLEKAWSPRILLVNRQTFMRTSLPEVLEIEPDGTVNYRQRYVGPISQPMKLSKFPFDRHDFTIQFVAVGYIADDLKFVPGESYQGDLKGGAMADKLSLPDWEVEKYQTANHPYEPIPGLELAGFDFTFTAKRYELYYIWQVIIPLVFIVIMSWGAFWIDPEHAGAQIGVATSSMLTLIAYRFMLGELIPRLPYMTRMDYFTLASTILVFLTFIEVITTTILVYKGKRKIGILMDNIARFIFPAAFTTASVWSLML
ncbi:MAG: hypothetical protein FVQ79_03875 [Planctomycetes bacterium]|nr:hypothetical protein [Planctomycetota bacterium]